LHHDLAPGIMQQSKHLNGIAMIPKTYRPYLTTATLLFAWSFHNVGTAVAQEAPNYQDPAFLAATKVITDEDMVILLKALGPRAPDELIPVSKAEGMFRLPGKIGTIYHFHVGDPASDGVLGNAFAFVEGGKLWGWYHFGEEPWGRVAGVTAPKGDRQNALMERRSIVDGVLTVDLDEVEFGHNWAQVVSTLSGVLVDGCGAEPSTNRKAAKVMFGHSGLRTEVVEQPCP
jgi:hypothetical protein